MNEETTIQPTAGAITVAEWCEQSGVRPDTLRQAFYRLGIPNFAKGRTLTPAEISLIDSHPFRAKGEKPAREMREKPVREMRENSPVIVVPAEKPVREMREKPVREMRETKQRRRIPTADEVATFFADNIARSIIVAHGVLIWREAAELYGSLGNIAGLLVLMFMVLAMLYASVPYLGRTSGNAVWFIGVVDVAAIFLHYQALARPGVPAGITIGFCIFIAATSLAALSFYRDSKQP